VDSDPDPNVLYDGPLVVMINRFSASASEIAAAALQDYGRAIIVGDSSTHGKGTVQSLNLLRPYVWAATPSATNDPGTLKITKGKFYRITGASTQLKGVASDIVLPDVLDHDPFVGESALDYPLPWDTIEPAQFTPVNRVFPYLAELRARSAARLATNQDFLYIKQDIADYEKMHEDRVATINEAEAIRQREDSMARNQARADERQGRPVPAVKVYQLTVENSGDPGLPPPDSFYTTNVVSTSYQGIPPVLYHLDGTNLVALPGKTATISTAGTNVVATWKNRHEITLPVGAAQWSGISQAGLMLQVNNPVELDRVTPDPYLDEAEHILGDYIGVLSGNSLQIVSH
jgi:carboxyl-terminal processing protease